MLNVDTHRFHTKGAVNHRGRKPCYGHWKIYCRTVISYSPTGTVKSLSSGSNKVRKQQDKKYDFFHLFINSGVYSKQRRRYGNLRLHSLKPGFSVVWYHENLIKNG